MKRSLIALLTSLLALSSPALAALPPKSTAETKDAAKEKPARSESDLQRIRDRNRRKAQEAWAQDKKKRNAKDYAEMESEYQEINKNYKADNVKDLLEAFIKKWKDGNRVGCATMYLAQKTNGPEREKLLKTCIDKFSDAYYLDGCSVGALSRLYMASWCQQNGKASEAKKLVEEIEKSWADAQDHSGNIIGDQAAELKKK